MVNSIILKNASIIDGSGKEPYLGHVQIIDDKIDSIVNDENVLITDNAKVIDLSGKFILPGLIDAHCHISFDELKNSYLEQVKGLIDGGIDLFIIETCQEIITELSETDNSIGTRLSKCRGKIDELCQIDSAFKNISNLVETAMIQLNEATLEIRSYLDGFNMDISQLSELENKLDKLNELARKYKTRPEELSNHLNQLIIKLNELEGGIEKQEELKQEKEKLVTEYHNISERLTKERVQTAIIFSNEITNKLHQLGMSGKLEIKIETMPNNEPRPQGMDNVIFMVSTNPGQPLRPITKVASGGELSRIGLAIQIICSKENNSSAMIFDEVDAGIGGSIAEIVGKLLNALAKNNQILCVTHLPQVASCGHHHFKVTKKAVAGETCTKVVELNQKERVNEIARMLAGMEVTNESLANAEKMLALK